MKPDELRALVLLAVCFFVAFRSSRSCPLRCRVIRRVAMVKAKSRRASAHRSRQDLLDRIGNRRNIRRAGPALEFVVASSSSDRAAQNRLRFVRRRRRVCGKRQAVWRRVLGLLQRSYNRVVFRAPGFRIPVTLNDTNSCTIFEGFRTFTLHLHHQFPSSGALRL